MARLVFVGGIGVSGDGVDQDEVVAAAGAVGYEPPAVIRVDCVLGIAGAYSNAASPCPGAEGLQAATPTAWSPKAEETNVALGG